LIESDIKAEIRELSIYDDNSQVTIIWMRSKSSDKSLFHLIAGSISEPVNGGTYESTVSTHYVFNDLLHDFVRDNSERALEPLSKDKRRSLLKNNPPFLITTSLPKFIPLSCSESDGDSDCDDAGSYECDMSHIVLPVEQLDSQGYFYENGKLSMTVEMP
jgi:hypothetical protein